MAKKEFAISNTEELKKISSKWERRSEDGRVIKPYFFGYVAKTKGYYNDIKKNYMHHDTTMDFFEEIIDAYRCPNVYGKKIKLTEILSEDLYIHNSVKYQQMNDILRAIEGFKAETSATFMMDSDMVDQTSKHLIYNTLKQNLIAYINKEINPNPSTLLAILRKLESEEYKHLRNYLVTILFNIGNESAFTLIKQSQRPVENLILDDGSADEVVELYGIKFAKTYKK